MTEGEKTYRRKIKIKALNHKEKTRKSSAKKSHRKFKLYRRTSAILEMFRDNTSAVKSCSYSIYSLSKLLPSKEQLNAKSITNNNLPSWEYIDSNKICFYQLVMQEVERKEKIKNQTNKTYPHRLQLVPFVFNLSYELQERLLRSKKSEVSECNDILNKSLKKSLGRSVQLWFSLEMARTVKGGKAHINGSLLISNREFQKVRSTLHSINGKARKGFKDYAVDFGDDKRQEVAQQNGLLFSDLKWALYCQKEMATVKAFFSDQDSNKYHKVFTASRELNKQAEFLYQQLRDAQWQANIKAT